MIIPEAEAIPSEPVSTVEETTTEEYGKVQSTGMKHIDIHIDWLDTYKSICIQAQYVHYYFDIQVEKDGFSIAYDLDEPDEAIENKLDSVDGFLLCH